MLFIFSFVGILPGADVVTLTNGQVIEVRIISENASEVEVEMNGVRQQISRSRIASIERDTEAANNPSYQKLIRAESMIESNQDAITALELFQEGLTEDPELLDTFEVLADRLIRATKSSIDQSINNGDGETALRGAVLLESESSIQIINATMPQEIENLNNYTRVSKGKAWTLIGIRHRDNNAFDDAVDAYGNALGLIQTTDIEYAQIQFLLGLAYKDSGSQAFSVEQMERAREKYRLALTAFMASTDFAQMDATLIPRAQTEITLVRDELLPKVNQALNPAVAAVSTPDPAGQNQPPPGPIQVTEAPEAAPVPEAVVEEKTGGFLAGIIGKEAGKSVHEAWASVFGETSPWLVFGILFGFIILYWIIPKYFLSHRVSKLDIVADQWNKYVWYAGIFAVLGYTYSYWVNKPKRDKESKPKHPCPHCGSALDDPMSYGNLQFEYCPNCGGEVKPLYGIEDYITFIGENMVKEAARIQKGTGSMQEFARKDSMQKLVRSLIVHGSRCRASDIHIEPGKQGVIIRQRVDGVMMEMVKLDSGLGPAVVSAIKVASDLDISEKRKPQDGSMQIEVDDYLLDLRVATSPSQEGEKATLRLLDSRTLEMSTKNLGMTKSSRELFEVSIAKPHGLVLVTGPTGSGKTTSLYVALQTLSKGDKNIISIEDPIEFRLSAVNQIQVNPTAGLTFASGLRSMLRQDPDIIMVGEIRDPETAEIAVNAAQTGHLVLSTLHTIDAASSVTRLYDLKVSPRQFADALDLVVAQRLIRMVCPSCRKDISITDAQLAETEIPKADYGKYKFVKGAGCDECMGTGFLGRTGIFEMFLPNATIKNFLQKGDFSTVELRELAISNGMRTLREEALVLLRQQMTTLEELKRVTQ